MNFATVEAILMGREQIEAVDGLGISTEGRVLVPVNVPAVAANFHAPRFKSEAAAGLSLGGHLVAADHCGLSEFLFGGPFRYIPRYPQL